MRVPAYYLKFKCIAERCRHSCCVGWEIDVDGQTLSRYRALLGEVGEKIRGSIVYSEDGAHFRLGRDERCPHLDKSGLCRIITVLGEGYLCDICREHPRFYHEIDGVWECGLGLACEEAARLVLATKDYGEFVEIADGEDAFTPETGAKFDAFSRRAALYADLRMQEAPLAVRLENMEKEYGLGVVLTQKEHTALFDSLEYLHEGHRALFKNGYKTEFAPQGALADACERFFAYLIFRHASPAASHTAFAAAVSFARTLTQLFCALASEGNAPYAEWARVISEELEYSEENTAAIRAALENGKKGG